MASHSGDYDSTRKFESKLCNSFAVEIYQFLEMLEWVEGMTLLYMAPEVLEPSKDCCSISRGEMEKADLWSLGKVSF